MPTSTHKSFDRLLVAAQQGDRAALEELYVRYDDALYRYLYTRCRDAVQTEEVLADLWVRVLENLPKFRLPAEGGELAFLGWLYRIARNLLINEYHNSQKRSHYSLEDDMPANLRAPDESLEQSEERAILQQAVAQLTMEQREVIVLRFFERRSTAEVAVLTGRTQGAVKALQHRALATLARLLKEAFGR